MSPIPLEMKKARRAPFMKQLYEITDGSATKFATVADCAADIDVSQQQADELRNYLVDEGLIKDHTAEGGWSAPISITHQGVVEVEQALEQPEQPTDHFPPAAYVVNIVNSTVTASPIAQASPSPTQTITYTGQQRQDLDEALRQIRELLDQDEFDEDDTACIRADLATIDVQLASSHPNWAAVQAVLNTLVAVLTVVTQAQSAVDIIRRLLPS
jgi:hypothetical protein